MTTPPEPHPSAARAVLEPGRLRALDATGLLGSAPDGGAPEGAFDRAAGLVERFLDVPVALVSLVGADRQVFKGQRGLPEPWAAGGQTPLSHSLCQHVVASGEPLVVDDARAHPLVCGNAAIEDLGVEAYLGVPVRDPSGHVLGSLCAIDTSPRAWTDGDRDALAALAASVETEVALRGQLGETERAEAAARDEAEALAAVAGVNARLASELDPDRLVQAVVDAGTAVTGAAFGAFFYSPGRGGGGSARGVGSALLFAVSGAPREAFERLGAVRMTPLFEPSFSGRGPVRSDDVAADPRYGRRGGMPAGHLPVRSYLSVPVRDGDRAPLGALLFGHPDPGVFDARDEQVAGAIADQAAIALRNARLHAALDESERRHRTVLANLNDVVFQTDRDGRYTYLNGAWAEKTGHAVADALGRHLLAFAAGDVDVLGARILRLTQESGPGDTFQVPVEVRHADGSTRHFEANWRPAFDDGGGHAGWAGTYTDVTDTVRYHAEREAREAAEAARGEAERSREEAERSARLQAAFLSNMSHEIRTPLTAVLGCAEVLADEVPDGLRDLADSIRSGGERLLGTLNAVLDLAQIDAGRMDPAPRPVDVAALLEAAAADVRPLAAGKGLAIDVEVPAALPALSLDPGLFDRVLGNLLGNAVKFTERGGVTVRARYDGAALHVEVADTGVGIAPEHLAHLFDEFRQVSEGDARTHEGNGLGLALARRVAALLGGGVRVESAVGEGSRFTVSVPAPRAASAGGRDGAAWAARADSTPAAVPSPA